MIEHGSTVLTEQQHELDYRPRIWGHVPLRNPDFVGRHELLELIQSHLTEPDAAVVQPEVLYGLAAIGKSQTAVEYIYRHIADYDVVWWIPSEQMTQITSSFAELGKKLNLPGTESTETGIHSVLEALRQGVPHRRWLLVFDNADNPEMVSQFFPAGTGNILITSRNSQWSGIARTTEVDLFTREESKELLFQHNNITDSEADRLAEALGDLPLAVEQAAAWRAQTGMPIDEYLQLLDQNVADLLGDQADSQLSVSGRHRSVVAAWSVPLNRLRIEHPAALQLLQLCAFFSAEPIPRRLFTAARPTPTPPELTQALSNPIKLNQAIREISRYSLAKIDHRNNTIQLHRLVQTVLKNELSESDQNDMRHAVHVLLVAGNTGDPKNSATWPDYAELLPHVISSDAIACQFDTWVQTLVLNLVSYLLRSGDYHSAKMLAAKAFTAWQTNLDENNESTLAMARHYSEALRRLGLRKEASTLNQQSIEHARTIFGEDSEIYLSIADVVAADLRLQGRLVDELNMQQDIVDKAQQLHGPDDPITLNYANSLAGCYRLTGQFAKARELDEHVLHQRKLILGAEHPDTFLTWNALAMDLRECGQYVEACRIQEGILTRQRGILGNSHPRIIGAVRNLAVAQRKAGQHLKAFNLTEECLDLYQRRHGKEHLDTITTQMCLAADLRHLDDLPRSRDVGMQSYLMFEKVYGQAHPFTMIAATNLAITLRLLDQTIEARELNEKARTTLREALGEDHPYTLVATTNLASDLAALGDIWAAYELDVVTFERSAAMLGSTHPSTLAVASNLSIDLDQLGRTDEAAVLRAKTITSFCTVLGKNHPTTLDAIRSIRANTDTDTMQL